jgi:allophanate hydrolase subunit 2
VRLWPGPRLDWFEQGAWTTLTTSRFTVGADSDRVGVRLAGHAIRAANRGELPSEGLVEGAVQVPPDGRPIVMLADHPVTGGYPVIAVVDRADLEVIAQTPPGSTIGFVSAR